jgi:polyphosphate kinase
VFHFHNGGKDDVFLSSADWMPRNFHRRVEAMFPVEDPALKARLLDAIALCISDNQKAWQLRSDGTYVRVQPKAGDVAVRSQARFMEWARDRVREAELGGRTSSRFYLPAPQLSDVRSLLTKAEQKVRNRLREPPKKGS